MKTPSSNSPYMPTPGQYLESLPPDDSKRPVTKPPKRVGRKIWKGLGIMIFLIILGVVSYASFIVYNVAKISTKPLDFSAMAADSTGRTNVLVLGVGDPGHAGEKLSDSIMVISLDRKTGKAAQISLPRDLQVPIPGFGSRKINSANALGGVELASQTVSNVLNIPIHHYVKTDFQGLVGLVDAVGGIEVDVKERLADSDYPCDDDQYKACGLVIEPGLQHMDGKRALQYSRCRKGTCGNDFGRAERQQEVVNLVREKLVQWNVLLNPAKVTPAVLAVRQGIETDMNAVQMLEFAKAWQEAQKNGSISLVLSTSPDGYLRNLGGTSDLVPLDGSFDAIADRVWHIFE